MSDLPVRVLLPLPLGSLPFMYQEISFEIKCMIRVGFLFWLTDETWMGGLNYFSNLVHAIGAGRCREIEPVLFVSPKASDAVLKRFSDVEIVPTAFVDIKDPLRRVLRAPQLLLGRDFLLERLLKKHGIAVVSHSGHLGKPSAIPTIGWMGDYQHIRMPEFFTQEEIAARNRRFKLAYKYCTMLLSSSYDGLNDLRAHEPAAAEKCRVLHFVAGFNDVKNEISLRELRKKYSFEGPFFYLPNQFWAHKNHRVVVDSLALLMNRKRRAIVLCTGFAQDRRQPKYFSSLMQHVHAEGVEESFRILGLVPYDDVSALMRHSVAVINPSFFEGWSTSVEESKSSGKTIILSDIAVHREQSASRSIYFDPHDAGALADAMERVLDNYAEAEDQFQFQLARRALPKRFVEFGETFQDIVFETIHRASMRADSNDPLSER